MTRELERNNGTLPTLGWQRLEPGDVLAFSGRGPVSRVIQMFTRSTISHVAIVGGQTGKPETFAVYEAIMGDGNNGGVRKTPLIAFRDSLKSDDKVMGLFVWRKPSDPRAAKMTAWLEFMLRHPYDVKGAIESAADLFDKVGGTKREDLSKLFCSELVAVALKEAGLLPKLLNASELTPADIVSLDIWDGWASLSGGLSPPKHFNCTDPRNL